MGKVRARKENGRLYLDFMYQGVRCREQTDLQGNPANIKKVDALLKKVEAKIMLDQFDYAEHFPGSKNLKKFMHNVSDSEHSLAQGDLHLRTPTFALFAEQWFKELGVQWRHSHTRNVRSILDSAILPTFGDMPIATITKKDLMTFRMLEANKPGRSGNATMTAKTINNRMSIVRMILDEAAERFDFESPYKNIKPLKLRRTHIEPFSLVEVNKIIERVRPDYRHYYAVRFFTGMRSGEIDGLKWEFVDFENKVILVRQTLIGGKTEYTKTNGSQRDIPMLGPVFEALKDQYDSTSKVSPYVFCNTEGQPLDQHNVTKRVWYPLLEHLLMKKRRPYQTRHTAATLFLASGENPEWVARTLGHSSTEMLFKVYSRYIPNLTRQDGSAFENLVKTTSNSKEM